MIGWLGLGLVLGVSGGLSPGPMTALVIGETVRHGTRSGIAVAFAPLLSDGPIIAVTVFLLGWLTDAAGFLGGISLAGAAFLVVLAWESFRAPPPTAEVAGKPRSLSKAVVANLLNPHPWLFWTTVGTPLLLDAWGKGAGGAAVFGGAFFLGLIGSKAAMALLVGRVRDLLRTRAYRLTMGVLGVALLALAAWLAWEGVHHLGQAVQ